MGTPLHHFLKQTWVGERGGRGCRPSSVAGSGGGERRGRGVCLSKGGEDGGHLVGRVRQDALEQLLHTVVRTGHRCSSQKIKKRKRETKEREDGGQFDPPILSIQTFRARGIYGPDEFNGAHKQ